MIRRALALALALVTAGPLAPRPVRAQAAPPAPPASLAASDTARAEARDRFDKGLRLFNAGDNAGALAEFRRAYELVDNAVVLYNIGLVYAQMGRAVDATEALNCVLEAPVALTPERVAIARRTRDEQAARIAEITIEASVDGAEVDVDGIRSRQDAARAPGARDERYARRRRRGTRVRPPAQGGHHRERREAVAQGRPRRHARAARARRDPDPPAGGRRLRRRPACWHDSPLDVDSRCHLVRIASSCGGRATPPHARRLRSATARPERLRWSRRTTHPRLERRTDCWPSTSTRRRPW